jgi:hypothetical protein
MLPSTSRAKACALSLGPGLVVGDDAKAVLQCACVVVDCCDNLIVLRNALLTLNCQRRLQAATEAISRRQVSICPRVRQGQALALY